MTEMNFSGIATRISGADLQSVQSFDIAPEWLSENQFVGFDSLDARSRPFNLLRTQLTKKMDGTRWRLLGVTSATPAAGKTFTSINLAAALSKVEGRKVVLCDFDLRRGSILRDLGVEAPIALNEYLAGEQDDWRNAVYRINDSDLFVLPTRDWIGDSSTLLSGDRFKRLIGHLRALPDEFISICDLPPVFANDDAMLCAQHLDAYLMVVDHGRTTARQIEESIVLLKPTPCIGSVLNRYQGGFADDYGYGYGDPYGLKEYGGPR